jgi:plastocyanin
VSVTADPGGSLAYEEDSLEAAAGELTVELTNDASLGHDVCIESPDGEDLGCSDVVTGDSSSVTADVSEPGEYTFYCSVDAHREAGMEGPLTVE